MCPSTGDKMKIEKNNQFPKQTSKARTILQYAREATDAFKTQCDKSREARRASGGATTHIEQDLLRAMLVFAAAGLDAVLKQLISDCLRDLAREDTIVQTELETFVTRQLRGEVDLDVGDAMSGRKFLAKVLAAREPQARLIGLYVKDLTGESLQSHDQVLHAAKALGVDSGQLKLEPNRLKIIFDVRNEIIHKLDIQLDQSGAGHRKRRNRTIEEMTGHAEYLLHVCERIVSSVEGKLRTGT